MTTFDQLGLAETLLRAVRDEGYHTATPIQQQAIPPLLAGGDLMGCAQTGTGKTAAFALPTLHRLSANRRPANGRQPGSRNGRPSRGDRRPIRALVLAPTRELAAQIGESFAVYGRHTGLRHAVVYGGVGQGPQVRALRAGVDILVATPGRLEDLMEQGHIDLRKVEVLILDEADQMLDMGFIVPLRRIVSAVPRGRQTLMFSATMPPEIRKLSGEWLRSPTHVQVAPVATPIELVEQSVYLVEPRHKPHLLTHFLQRAACTRTIVFARTKHGADKIVKQLVRSGIRAVAIHGNKSQSVRQRVLAEFKSDRPPVLVATDVAARGLDVDGVSHVVNYELPSVAEMYVHRIGRTARAGATGVATSFCGHDERGLLRDIERLTRQTIVVADDHPEYPAGLAPASLSESNGARTRRPAGARGRRGKSTAAANRTAAPRSSKPGATGAAASGRPKRARRRYALGRN